MFGMHWFPFGWLGGIGCFGFIAIIVIVIVLVTRSGHNHRWEERRTTTEERRAPSHAEDILKERLARGEIDEETYEKLLSKIR